MFKCPPEFEKAPVKICVCNIFALCKEMRIWTHEKAGDLRTTVILNEIFTNKPISPQDEQKTDTELKNECKEKKGRLEAIWPPSEFTPITQRPCFSSSRGCSTPLLGAWKFELQSLTHKSPLHHSD